MNSQSELTARALHGVSRWSLYALFFLLPIFFLPWTNDAFETNKQALLIVLVGLAMVGWLAGMVLSQSLAWRSGWLNLIPALFFGSVLASGIASLAGYASWIGGGGQEYTSVLTIGALVVLFYVLANAVGTFVSLRHVLAALFLSSALGGLVTVLGMLNVVHLPFAIAQNLSFNTVGTINHLAVFLLAVLFIGLTAWLTWPIVDGVELLGGKLGALLRVLTVVLAVLALFVMLVADFWVLWVLAIAGVMLVLSVGFLKGDEFPRPTRFLLPFCILVISALFLFLPSPVRLKLPVVVSPSYQGSWDIARQTLSENPLRLVLGSGPGTFTYDYALHKSPSVNATVFWSVLFDRAKSDALTALATFGILGLTLWVLFFLVLGIQAVTRLAFERHLGDWKSVYVLFVPWVVLVLAHVLYSSNMTLEFLLWGISGLLASQVMLRIRIGGFAQAPRLALVTSFVFVFLCVGTVVTLVVAGQRYAAEVAFAQAVQNDRAQGNVDDTIASLSRAAGMSPLLQNDIYYRNLSAAYFAKAQGMLQANPKPTQEQWQGVAQVVQAGTAAAVKATQLEPNNVADWIVLGSVYRDLLPFANGAEDSAAAAFEKAAALEPANPSHQVNLGRVHLAVSDRARSLKSADDKDLAAQATEAEKTELAAAETSFNNAIALKPDYALAHYYLAAVYEREGRLDDATKRLAALTQVRPADVGLGFQLAMLYLRQDKQDLAQAELERIVGLEPDYSNALWYLSAIYERNGDTEKALAYAQKVLDLNPDNETVKARVASLKAGGTDTSLPAPVEEGATPLEASTEPSAETP